ncbi:hypothetical protein LguiA_025539 [Lonicera macranthoides]
MCGWRCKERKRGGQRSGVERENDLDLGFVLFLIREVSSTGHTLNFMVKINLTIPYSKTVRVQLAEKHVIALSRDELNNYSIRKKTFENKKVHLIAVTHYLYRTDGASSFSALTAQDDPRLAQQRRLPSSLELRKMDQIREGAMKFLRGLNPPMEYLQQTLSDLLIAYHTIISSGKGERGVDEMQPVRLKPRLPWSSGEGLTTGPFPPLSMDNISKCYCNPRHQKDSTNGIKICAV